MQRSLFSVFGKTGALYITSEPISKNLNKSDLQAAAFRIRDFVADQNDGFHRSETMIEMQIGKTPIFISKILYTVKKHNAKVVEFHFERQRHLVSLISVSNDNAKTFIDLESILRSVLSPAFESGTKSANINNLEFLFKDLISIASANETKPSGATVSPSTASQNDDPQCSSDKIPAEKLATPEERKTFISWESVGRECGGAGKDTLRSMLDAFTINTDSVYMKLAYSVAGPIVPTVYHALQASAALGTFFATEKDKSSAFVSFVENQYKEFICYKTEAKVKVICRILAEIGTGFVPIGAVGKISKVKKITDSVSKGEVAVAIERVAQAEKGLKPKGPKVTKDTVILERLMVGSDDAKEVVELAKLLRARKIDPIMTHIPEFEKKIEPTLNFARKSIESQDIEVAGRLKILDEFAAEAAARVKDKKVSYEWFNEYNYRLSVLMTPASKRTSIAGDLDDAFVRRVMDTDAWRTDELFRKAKNQDPSYFSPILRFADDFPMQVKIPVINGDMGIAAVNSIYGSDSYVIGKISKNGMFDGRDMWPDHFDRHDHVHARNERFFNDYSNISKAQRVELRKNYLVYRDRLPNDQRSAFEFSYFVTTHELGATEKIIRKGGEFEGLTTTELIGKVRDPHWFEGAVPPWATESAESAKKFLDSAQEELKKFSAQYYRKQ